MFDARHVKNLVETAIRLLDRPGWHPKDGGEWKSKDPEAVITFHKGNRFQPKPCYTLCGPEFGLWVGNLNHLTGRNVGKPTQNFTPEQIKSQGLRRE